MVFVPNMWPFPWHRPRGSKGCGAGRHGPGIWSRRVHPPIGPPKKLHGSHSEGRFFSIKYIMIYNIYIYIYRYSIIIYIYIFNIYNYIQLYILNIFRNDQKFIFHRFGCFSHTEMGVSWTFHEWDFSWGRSPRAPAEASRSILVEALELTWDRVQDSLFLKLRFTCCFPVFYDLLCVYVFTLHENLMLSDVICIYIYIVHILRMIQWSNAEYQKAS